MQRLAPHIAHTWELLSELTHCKGTECQIENPIRWHESSYLNSR